jgi:predicted nucleotidyltransferase component of viral defense system
MKPQTYKKQVSLLLNVLPEVAKESCFALHGGTAINLFVRDMPRLSVDIDLTYIPVENRSISLNNISDALEKIKARVEDSLPNVRVLHKRNIAKLLVSSQGADIKIEVNLVGRGTLGQVRKMALSEKAQNEFDVFCAIPTVSFGQLYGGKICAALDRQHPRDLFDVKYLLENEGFSDEVKEGVLLSLLSSDRPINEIINPHYLDETSTMANQFLGMSHDSFNYHDFELTRKRLVKTVRTSLTAKDKEFLLGVKSLAPDWSTYDFEKFPAVKWKLKNLQKLKDTNPEKHQKLYDKLETALK